MTATRPSTTNPARNKISASLSWSLDFTSMVVAALRASHHIFFSHQQSIQTTDPSLCGCKVRSFLEDKDGGRTPTPLLCFNSPSSAHKLRRSDYAHRGLHLLESSLHISSSSSPRPPAPADSAFSRDLYVHALAHLLRALPRDLPPDQAHALASALPPRRRPGPQEQEQQACVDEEPQAQPPQPSLLRRVLASCVLFLFLLARFLLPCARDAAAAACAYDREHGISERAVSRGAEVGRQCWEVAVGTARSPGLAWWVGEICHGAADGFGRGLELMGLGRDGGGGGGVWDGDCYYC